MKPTLWNKFKLYLHCIRYDHTLVCMENTNITLGKKSRTIKSIECNDCNYGKESKNGT